MATYKSKSIPPMVAKRTPNVALTLAIPVPKPRNRVAMNPLLKKSAVHADALELQQGVHDALNRRRGSQDKGFEDTANNG